VLCEERLRVTEAYYLVYPKRSEGHSGVSRFREWLLAEAKDYEEGLGDGTRLGAWRYLP